MTFSYCKKFVYLKKKNQQLSANWGLKRDETWKYSPNVLLRIKEYLKKTKQYLKKEYLKKPKEYLIK